MTFRSWVKRPKKCYTSYVTKAVNILHEGYAAVAEGWRPAPYGSERSEVKACGELQEFAEAGRNPSALADG